jgi:hypothetical protein
LNPDPDPLVKGTVPRILPGVLAFVPVDAGAGPPGPLEIALNPRGLFLIEDKDEDSVLPAPVILLRYIKL